MPQRRRTFDLRRTLLVTLRLSDHIFEVASQRGGTSDAGRRGLRLGERVWRCCRRCLSVTGRRLLDSNPRGLSPRYTLFHLLFGLAARGGHRHGSSRC